MKKNFGALKTSKPIKNNKSFDNERLLKYKEIFDGLSSETIGEIYNMSKHIDFNKLTYYFKDQNISPINFVGFRGRMHIFNNIKNADTSIEKTVKIQEQFTSNLNNIAFWNRRYKSEDQLN